MKIFTSIFFVLNIFGLYFAAPTDQKVRRTSVETVVRMPFVESYFHMATRDCEILIFPTYHPKHQKDQFFATGILVLPIINYFGLDNIPREVSFEQLQQLFEAVTCLQELQVKLKKQLEEGNEYKRTKFMKEEF